MQISIYVPEYGTIEGITPAYRSFHMANEIRSTFDKPPIFNIEYVGLNKYVPANNGEYTIKTDRLLKDVTHTDLLVIPPIYGQIS
ncbi:MAG: AraC family transcriptional regulator, partial [Sphingobacterium sp.]